MAKRPHVLGVVLAGGEGKRLWPLTRDRAKPAVPFGANYRIIDFALSNLVNGRYLRIAVLTQYKSHSLDRHIAQTWRMSPLFNNFVMTVPAQMRLGPRWFEGSADAIFQNLNLIQDENPDYICVFGADHIYRMDPEQIIDAHMQSGASVTVAAIRVPIEEASRFGVIVPGANNKIASFAEKPQNAVGLPDDPKHVFASMGNYVFNTKALIDAVHADAANKDSAHDMGGNIITAMVDAGQAAVYDFHSNKVPGATERDAGYWRDVGTLDAYYEAQMDLISVHPIFNLYNHEWPIHSSLGRAAAGEVRVRRRPASRHGHRLDGRGGRDRLGRGGAPFDPVARCVDSLARERRRLGVDARRGRGPRRDHSARHLGQEREGSAGRAHRRRPGRRSRARLHLQRQRHRRRRQRRRDSRL